MLEKILESLTDEQKSIVTSNSEYIKVTAGPGTGKTETLTRRILFLLLNNVEPSSIVAFTFTEKAAQSLKSRIYQRIYELDPNSLLLNKLSDLFAGTIHSFCLKLLRDHFNYDNYSVLDENQEFAFVSRFFKELKLEELVKKKLTGYRIYDFNIITYFINSVNIVYDNLIDINLLKLKDPIFYESFSIYESLLRSNKLLTFSQMVYLAVLQIPNKLNSISNIKFLFVDEYQDINPAQEKLIELIGKSSSVFVVGDPRQTIYQWRGSDESCFHSFHKKFPKATNYNLTINHRSTPLIIQIANKFSKSSPYLNIYPEIISPKNLNLDRTYKLNFKTPEEEAEWIANTIESYVQNFNGNYGDCAVLYRSVYLSASPLINILRSRNIPYIVAGKVSLFQRPEIKALAYLFAWLAPQCYFLENGKNLLSGNKLLEEAINIWGTYITTLPPSIYTKLHEIKKGINDNKFRDLTHLLYKILDLLNFKSLDHNITNHHIIIANIGRFASILADFEFPYRLNGNKINLSQLLRNLYYFINNYAYSHYDEPQPESLSQFDAVNILTIHQAKGLEWPIVFLPSLQHYLFPLNRDKVPYWLIDSSLFDSSRYITSEKSESQLFYVALTRAKDFLFVSYYQYDSSGRAQRRTEFLNDISTHFKYIDQSHQINFSTITQSQPQKEIPILYVTDLLDYLKCPLFYLLRKILNYPSGIDFMIGYGESLHLCTRLITQFINQENFEKETAIEKAIEEFHLPFATNYVRDKAKGAARNTLLNFVSHPEARLENVIATEIPTELLINLNQNLSVLLSAKIDAILQNQSTIEIRDYKTSSRFTPFNLALIQLYTYAYILQSKGIPVSKVSIVYLEDPEPNNFKSISIQPKELEEVFSLVKYTIEQILEKNYPPKPENGYCHYCDYRTICKFASK